MIFTRFCRLMHLQINMRQHLTRHPTQMATMAKSSISPASEVPAQTQPANELMLYGAPILIAPISAGVSISSRTFLESLQITLIQIRSLRMLVRFHGRKLLHLADFQSPISEYWPDCFSFVGFGAGLPGIANATSTNDTPSCSDTVRIYGFEDLINSSGRYKSFSE